MLLEDAKTNPLRPVDLREESVVLRLLVVIAFSRETFGTPVSAFENEFWGGFESVAFMALPGEFFLGVAIVNGGQKFPAPEFRGFL